MRLFACVLVTFLLLFKIFLYPGYAFASIVINEFSSDTAGTNEDPDWIELYNTGPDAVDLSAFRLRDNSATNKQDFSDVLNGNSFLWVNLQKADMLNRSGDRIRLVQKTNESELVDLIVYGNEDDASVPAPSKGQSLGRKIDGGSEWVVFSTQTKGETNNSSQVVVPTPTNSLTPTISPTPKNTPTITKSPTPSKTPTSIKASTPTKVPTSTRITTSIKSPTPAKLIVNSSSSSSNNHTQAVLAENTDQSELSDEWDSAPTPILELGKSEKKLPKNESRVLGSTQEKKENSFPFFAILSIVISILSVGYGILFYLKKRKLSEGKVW